jgi:glycosyltransferase involved in cell wall biosynthesis
MSQVDVVIPCYKYAHFLRACVQSVLLQTGVDVRVLVIDDCSPDNTPDVGAKLAAEDKRVEFRRHKTNLGHIATYNEGLLNWAAGEYCLLLSADDMLTPGALVRAACLLDAHPELGFIYGRAIATETPEFHSVSAEAPHQSRIVSGAEFWQASCEATGNLVPTPTAVVRTKLQHLIGGYRPELPHTGDLEMWMRFAAQAPVGVIPADQAFYRIHGNNMHKKSYVEDRIVLDQHKEAFDLLFREYGDRFPNGADLHRKAMRGVANSCVARATRAFEDGQQRTCRELLAFAESVYPPIRQETRWSRLRVKRLMGSHAWGIVGGALRAVRGKRLPLERHPFCHSQLIPEV